MRTEKTKDNGTKEECADFGCCDPGNFKKMFEMMNKCCPDQSNSTDFSAMMSGMMKNMTQLRQKMIRAMELKNLSHYTQRAYLAVVTGIARFYNQSPDKMTKEKIEDYLLYLKQDKGNAPNSCYSVLTGLRFFYKYVIKNEIPVTYSIRRRTRKLPQVLTMEEIWKIICSTNNLKHRMILMTTYSAGLRASEVIKLKPEHIDSKTIIFCLSAAGLWIKHLLDI